MKRLKLLIYIGSIIFCWQLYGSEWTGDSSAVFLKIPVGAKNVGLGEATTAVADGTYALLGNVANIAVNNTTELSFSHIKWFGDTDYEFIGFIKPLQIGLAEYPGIVGGAISYLHLPFFNSYDSWGEFKEEVSFSDFALTTGYAQQITKWRGGDLFSGLTLKIINENLNRNNDTALAVSLGFLYSLKIPKITIFKKRLNNRVLDIGFLMENWSLGTEIGGHTTPVIYKLGFGFKPFNSFLYSLDFHLPLDNRIRINMGSEYSFNNIFFRLGYRFLGYEVDSFSCGIGAKFELGGKLLKADIAYAPLSSLGNNINFSLTIKYTGGISEQNRNLANTYYYKGIYYHLHNQYDEAIKMWQKALEIYPDFSRAKAKIQDALKLKQLEKIEEEIPEKYRKK